MNTVELLDKKNILLKEMEELISNGKKEERKLNEVEEDSLRDKKEQINKIDEELRMIENKLNNTTKEERTMSNFSLLKAINDIANNRQLDETAQSVVNAGISEMRKAGQSYSGQIILPVEQRADVKATAATAGKEAIATDVLDILAPLRQNLVMVNAGATYMTGLIGNVQIPAYSGTNVNWADEVATATDGAGTFSEVTLEPKRLTAFIDVSKQFLILDSASAEAMLRKDIVDAVRCKLESTILGDAAGSTKQPEGIFKGVSADQKAVSYKEVVEMQSELENANVMGDLTYIVNPKAKSLLKTTPKAANGSTFLMEGNEVDGIKVLSTSAVKENGVVLGNFSDYVIGQWGGFDLTVDPFTKATDGKVRIVINSYFDAKPRRKESFSKRILKAEA